MMFEVGKTYETRDGDQATIVHILDEPDDNGDAIIGLRKGEVTSWGLDGKFDGPRKSRLDLMPPEPEIVDECWKNVYGDGTIGHYDCNNQAHADKEASGAIGDKRLGVVIIKVYADQTVKTEFHPEDKQ